MIVSLRIVCGRCDRPLMRWWADTDEPFPDDLGDASHNEVWEGVLSVPAPGIDYRIPIRPDREPYVRYEVTCPSCQIRRPYVRDKLERAVLKVLRVLYDTRYEQLTTTADRLLKLAA